MKMLNKKIALITGSTKGIGKSIAYEFSKQGANVIITARNQNEINEIVKNIKTKYNTEPLGIRMDITKQQDVDILFKEIIDRHSKIDVLINNAGYPLISKLWNMRFHEVTDEDYGKIFEVDVMGAIRCTRKAIPIMMENKNGVVINISSTPTISGHDKGVAYTIAKSGLSGLTKHIAYEYGKYNIRANTLALGNIKTAKTYDILNEKEKKLIAEESILNRWGEPRDVAKTCAFLSSDYSEFITGQTIIVDGGATIR